jgi:hypothetical protein
MHAPLLNPSSRRFHLPGQPHAAIAFEIRTDGRVDGRAFSSGEHLLLEPGAQDGDAVVLVATGPGRPRLGFVRGATLVGDRGEPCARSRWSVAGRIVGVARPLGADWRVEPFDAPHVVGLDRTQEPAAPERPGQLSLFVA